MTYFRNCGSSISSLDCEQARGRTIFSKISTLTVNVDTSDANSIFHVICNAAQKPSPVSEISNYDIKKFSKIPSKIPELDKSSKINEFKPWEASLPNANIKISTTQSSIKTHLKQSLKPTHSTASIFSPVNEEPKLE
ncbi:hypothetical protein AVEN_50247-1 [Araneus ventricosus]|uniref:Uncharacterized protein n=1 Tax=Araneus ventricosus TaxID=182803 RepID=A0A4Y2E8N6_ARAVE|nr:hypothetical protein AVEN_50247-1 [Araneus ventricosus]